MSNLKAGDRVLDLRTWLIGTLTTNSLLGSAFISWDKPLVANHAPHIVSLRNVVKITNNVIQFPHSGKIRQHWEK